MPLKWSKAGSASGTCANGISTGSAESDLGECRSTGHSPDRDKKDSARLTTRELTIFAMLGAVMYASKMLLEVLPNVHLLGTFVVAFTVVYRKKALYPIYLYVLLNGIFSGFATWWVPYLYVWTILWAAVMLLPRHMSKKRQPFVYMAVCAAHGFLFGTLYAPAQAILFGLNCKGMIAWIIAGLPWDFVHGVSNFFCGILIVPVISLLRFAENRT